MSTETINPATGQPEQPVVADDTQGQKIDALVDAIDPRSIVREQRFAGVEGSPLEGFDVVYKQRPLSVLPQMEFNRVIGKALREVISQSGASFTSLFGGFRDALGDVESLMGGGVADIFIQAILQLAEHSQDIVNDTIMIALGVPQRDRPIIAEILQQPHEDGRGGLTQQQFKEIMVLFVQQNAKELVSFFADLLPEIYREAEKALSPTSGS